MPAVAPVALRAGPLTLLFEPATASLRYLTLDGREVLRRVYAAVRDHNWGTVEGSVTMVRQDVGADAFALEFETCASAGAGPLTGRSTARSASASTVRRGRPSGATASVSACCTRLRSLARHAA